MKTAVSILLELGVLIVVVVVGRHIYEYAVGHELDTDSVVFGLLAAIFAVHLGKLFGKNRLIYRIGISVDRVENEK